MSFKPIRENKILTKISKNTLLFENSVDDDPVYNKRFDPFVNHFSINEFFLLVGYNTLEWSFLYIEGSQVIISKQEAQ